MFLILTNVRLKKPIQETVFLELRKEITDTCCCIGPPDLETITMVFSTKKSKSLLKVRQIKNRRKNRVRQKCAKEKKKKKKFGKFYRNQDSEKEDDNEQRQ